MGSVLALARGLPLLRQKLAILELLEIVVVEMGEKEQKLEELLDLLLLLLLAVAVDSAFGQLAGRAASL